MTEQSKFKTHSYEFNRRSQIFCYLIHGFSSTTGDVNELAKFLGEKGFHTRADLLYGHGTTVKDCNSIKYTEWFSQVEIGLAEMLSQSETVYVVGVSMGSTLALHLASMFPVKGIVIGSPALKTFADWKLKYLNPFLCHIIPSLLKTGVHKDRDKENIQLHGYESYPMKGVNQYLKIIDEVIPNINKITAPILIQHGLKDDTASKENIDIIHDNVKSDLLQIKKYENTGHHIFEEGAEQKQIFEDLLRFIQKVENA